MSTSPAFRPQSELEPPPSNTRCDCGFESDEPVQYPQFILFGDSITQFSTLTLQAYLQTQYIRRLDVINRGFSGFTSVMAFRALPKFLALSSNPPNIKLITIFFGANDACIPGEAQHIELQTYVTTIKAIINYAVSFARADCKTQIIVITPPPVNENQLEPKPSGILTRRAGITSQYARAAAQIGRSCGVCVLDFWTTLMTQAGWNESMGIKCCCDRIPYSTRQEKEMEEDRLQHIPGCQQVSASVPGARYELSDFLVDGLHLTKLGYDILFTELMRLIRNKLPDCAPENLPLVFPDWKDLLAVPTKSIV